MANIKITDLTAYTDAASTDVLPIVDVSADVTKKIAIGDIVKAVPQGTAALPGLAFDGDPNTGVTSPGADQVAISTNGTERMRIDSSGKLLIGTSSARTNIDYAFGTTAAPFQIERADALPCAAIVSNYDSATIGAPAYFTLARTGSTAIGSTTIVADGNYLGEIDFSGSDGTDFTIAASIRGEVDGTPGANDMPGRLIFSTTADGAASPTERMRIKNDGTINFSNVAVYADNAAAKTGGLVDGDVYRTSTGDLKIVYT